MLTRSSAGELDTLSQGQLLDTSNSHSIVDYPLILSVTAVTLSAVLGFLNCRKGLPAPKGTQPVSAPVLVLRGLLAAAAIGVAVVLSTKGTAFVAGLASCSAIF